ncbi:MAG: glycosyltransferase [Actinomycetia bacterium]|nr:glycosyltransferase [Actinomycetes bacterium]
MDSAVIVCTRNRPDEVRRLLGTLPSQTVQPMLIVVDASDDEATEVLVDEFTRAGLWMAVDYTRAEPGLTRQRMAGVRRLQDQVTVVHFIDDDVVLEPEYFESIERAFRELPEALGIGGMDTALTAHSPGLAGRLFGFDNDAQGRVLRSGHPVLVYNATTVIRVDWLSGCGMSFRRSVFDRHAFDESLEGYSLGEDVDFTYRVSREGPLYVTPRARLRHCQSPRDRAAAQKIASDDVVRRHEFVRRMRGSGMSTLAFWWSVYGEELVLGLKSTLGLDADAAARCQGMAEGVRRIRGGSG